jgi:hypothetical protein
MRVGDGDGEVSLVEDRQRRLMVGIWKNGGRETHLPPFFDGFHFGSVGLEFLFRHDSIGFEDSVDLSTARLVGI